MSGAESASWSWFLSLAMQVEEGLFWKVTTLLGVGFFSSTLCVLC